eukprot:COSAG01_NODE_35332_length_533_cov_1.368664_1_plen_50_part_10
MVSRTATRSLAGGALSLPSQQVVFERALGIARNSVVLPVGYALASSSVSG